MEWAEKVVKSMKRNIESMGMDFKCNDLCTLENIDTLLTSYATKALEVPIIQDDDSGKPYVIVKYCRKMSPNRNKV